MDLTKVKALETLEPGEHINDIIIDDYYELLQIANPSLHAFSCFFSSGIESHGISGNLSAIGKQLDLNGKNVLLFPFNHSLHWSLAVVKIDSSKRATYFLYDSLINGIEIDKELDKFFKLITQFLAKYYSDLIVDDAITVAEVPKQSNLVDCGVFICEYARCLSQGIAMDFTQKDIPLIRKVIKECLLQNKLIHFKDFQKSGIKTRARGKITTPDWREPIERKSKKKKSSDKTEKEDLPSSFPMSPPDSQITSSQPQPQPQPQPDDEAAKLFDSAVKILKENLTYEQFRVEAVPEFESFFNLLTFARYYYSINNTPYNPVNSISSCDFKNLFIHCLGDSEFQLFARVSNKPLVFKNINKELLLHVREEENHYWCNWDGCPCKNMVHNNLKGLITRHLYDTHYGFVCCECGNVLKNKTVFQSHIGFCGGKETGKKRRKQSQSQRARTGLIIDETGEEEEGKESDGQNNLDTSQKNSLIEQFMQQMLCYKREPDLKTKIIFTATSSILDELVRTETIRIKNLSSFPRYFIEKDKPFVIYEIGLKLNSSLSKFEAAIASVRTENDLYFCNYFSCMFCAVKSQRFSSDNENAVKAHIGKHFKVACFKCCIGFSSFKDLEAHYKESCLDNGLQNWLQKKFDSMIDSGDQVFLAIIDQPTSEQL